MAGKKKKTDKKAAPLDAEPAASGVAETMRQLASRAGLAVRVMSPDQVAVPFDMGAGRTQAVFVRLLGRDGTDGRAVLGFFSPAAKLPPGKPLAERAANDLLRRNGGLPHGSWAVLQLEGADYLGMFDTADLDTLAPEDFKAIALTLSRAADDLEKELGADAF